MGKDLINCEIQLVVSSEGTEEAIRNIIDSQSNGF